MLSKDLDAYIIPVFRPVGHHKQFRWEERAEPTLKVIVNFELRQDLQCSAESTPVE